MPSLLQLLESVFQDGPSCEHRGGADAASSGSGEVMGPPQSHVARQRPSKSAADVLEEPRGRPAPASPKGDRAVEREAGAQMRPMPKTSLAAPAKASSVQPSFGSFRPPLLCTRPHTFDDLASLQPAAPAVTSGGLQAPPRGRLPSSEKATALTAQSKDDSQLRRSCRDYCARRQASPQHQPRALSPAPTAGSSLALAPRQQLLGALQARQAELDTRTSLDISDVLQPAHTGATAARPPGVASAPLQPRRERQIPAEEPSRSGGQQSAITQPSGRPLQCAGNPHAAPAPESGDASGARAGRGALRPFLPPGRLPTTELEGGSPQCRQQ